MEASFSYKASARPIQDRAKYRDDSDPTKQFCNIAVDPRIYRGSTYARRSIMTEQVQKIPSYPKKVVARSADEEFDALHRDGYSEALVQTDDFDGNVIIVKKEQEIGIQTDPYTEKPIVHRKPAPLRAVGVKTDVPGTALFDFNIQVQPIVTTLCQKAMAQALMEVAEELELEQMHTYLKAFDHKAKVDAQAIARIEQAEQKKYEEKERIVAERLKIEEAQLEMRAKVLARGYAEYFVWDLEKDVMRTLERNGYFYDETEKEIELQFMPWLTEQANAHIAKASIPKALAEKAIQTASDVYAAQCNEVKDEQQIVQDRNAASELRNLRRMIAEDKVSAGWRIAKAKKRAVPKKNDEEEDDDDKATDAPTEGTYEYSEA